MIKIGWWEYIERIKDLAVSVSKASPQFIVSPVRGGLIPGVIISHELNIPFFPIVRQGKHKDLWEIAGEYPASERAIIIDDIIDSGKTMRKIQEDCFPRRIPSIAAIFAKGPSLMLNDQRMTCPIYGQIIRVDEIVQFPYEKI